MRARVVVPVAVPAFEVISLNQRAHWANVHRQTQALRGRGMVAAQAVHGPHLRKAALTVSVIYPRTTRRRDVHNLMGTVKPLLDGMVDARVIPDDNDDHLVGPDLRVWHGGDRPEVDDALGTRLMGDLARPGTWLGFVFEFEGEAYR